MKKFDLRSKPWYATSVSVVIGVVLYVLLMRWADFRQSVDTFVGYFSPVILGCVLAYLINPLERMYENRVFRRVRSEKKRVGLSNTLAFATVVLFVVLLLLVLLPQLFESISTFVGNLDGYIASLEAVLESSGLLSRLNLDLDSLYSLVDSPGDILKSISTYLMNHLKSILSSSASAGRQLFQWIIGFMLSMYLLASKRSLRTGTGRLMRAMLGSARYAGATAFLRRCNAILSRYIVYNLLDSFIVGIVNAIFMLIAGMPYVGLVSFVVAITNLIPTFGPIVGCVIGAFALVLVKPWYALAFLAFTLVLQTLDGYVLKPRLFGSSLGVSGLWILIGVIVGGRMFGVIGILLAIPGVAILDFIYRDYLLPWLEKRRRRRDGSGSPGS